MSKNNERKYDEVLTGMGYQIEIKYFNHVPYLNASDICKYRDNYRNERPAYDLIREFLSHPKTRDYIVEWMERNLLFTESKAGAGPSFSELKRSDRNTTHITATAMSKICPALVKVERGKYGKVWFHNELALKLAAYVSPGFDVYITKDYKHLKLIELNATPLPDDYWSTLREMVDEQHLLMVDAIRSRMIVFGEIGETPFSPENLKDAIKDVTDRIDRIVPEITDDKEERLLLTAVLSRWVTYRAKDGAFDIFIDTAIRDAAKTLLESIRKKLAKSEKESVIPAYQNRHLSNMKAQFVADRDSGKIYQGDDGYWYDKETNLMVLVPAL